MSGTPYARAARLGAGFTGIALVLTLSATAAFAAVSKREWNACLQADPKIAIPACTRILLKDRLKKNDVSTAYGLRGNAYYRAGDAARAIADFDEALRANPNEALAYASRGLVYQGQGDNARAVEDFSKAIAVNPKDHFFYYSRGLSYRRMGDLDRAIADYSAAIRLNDKEADYFNNRGNAHADRGENDQAFADYDRAIALNKTFVNAYYNRGLLRLNTGDTARAIVDFNWVIDLNPSDAGGYLSRGIAHEQSDQFERAVADLDRAIELDPNSAPAHNSRGYAYLRKGETDKARQDFRRALAIDPNHQKAKENLAVLDASGQANHVAEREETAEPPPETAKTELPPVAIEAAGRRVALVIGNSAYANTPPLANPRNDAEDMAAALSRLGFTVIAERDLDKRGMDDAFRRFAREIRGADAVVFYYAGHALQFEGVNYLMPVDARLADEVDLPYEMAKLDDVLADMGRASGVRIAVLDSCRNNPLEERLKSSTASTRAGGMTRGLARLHGEADGMLVAYATQPGQVAADGEGRNSPFTAALLRNLDTQGLEVGLLFRRVAQSVYKDTAGKQLPELSVSLLGEFYFRP